MQSKIFPLKPILIGGEMETLVHGGRDLFPLIQPVLDAAVIREIVVLGWGSQGPAQAPNFRDTLSTIGSSTRVRIGLRAGSDSAAKAQEAGFEVVEMFEGVQEADLVICLINDAGQVQYFHEIVAAMKSGATLGFSHGFLIGYLEGVKEKLRSDINIIGVCPKGMGPSVRRLYLQGIDIGGAGINSSIAVEQDYTGHAWDIAIAWAVAIGSPTIFETTLGMEWRSDLVGERSILLGAVWGIVEAMFAYYLSEGMSREDAFKASVESLTGSINEMLAKSGLIGLYRSLDEGERSAFRRAYNRAYKPMRTLIQEIYDEVSSGREIGRVIAATRRLPVWNGKLWMPDIDRTPMWEAGETVRAQRDAQNPVDINPYLAGIYVACMMAQIDVLRLYGHSWSEVCNESIIEAFASLTPFMHAKGISWMVDNCSITARLGTRVWGPRFEHAIRQQVLALPRKGDDTTDHFAAFEQHAVHDALAECMKYQPPVSIAVVVE